MMMCGILCRTCFQPIVNHCDETLSSRHVRQTLWRIILKFSLAKHCHGFLRSLSSRGQSPGWICRNVHPLSNMAKQRSIVLSRDQDPSHVDLDCWLDVRCCEMGRAETDLDGFSMVMRKLCLFRFLLDFFLFHFASRRSLPLQKNRVV